MFIENRKRAVVKTVSWRLLASLTTMGLVFLFVGKVSVAAVVGSVEVIAKMVLYYADERLWNKLNFGRREFEPFVLWLTGLSGAGKSTLANEIYCKLKKKGYRIEQLDGDSIRDIFPQTGFSKEERDNHIKRVGYLASMLEKNGVIVISSFISPYKETREFVRKMCNNFCELYVSVSLEECERRDVKGLYQKARAGEIKNFTGIDDPYEKPDNPEILIETENNTVEKSVDCIMKKINKLYGV